MIENFAANCMNTKRATFVKGKPPPQTLLFSASFETLEPSNPQMARAKQFTDQVNASPHCVIALHNTMVHTLLFTNHSYFTLLCWLQMLDVSPERRPVIIKVVREELRNENVSHFIVKVCLFHF